MIYIRQQQKCVYMGNARSFCKVFFFLKGVKRAKISKNIFAHFCFVCKIVLYIGVYSSINLDSPIPHIIHLVNSPWHVGCCECPDVGGAVAYGGLEARMLGLLHHNHIGLGHLKKHKGRGYRVSCFPKSCVPFYGYRFCNNSLCVL